MFYKKDHIRTYIFIAFCIAVTAVSFMITYYTVYEEKMNLDSGLRNEHEHNAELNTKVENEECSLKEGDLFTNSFWFKMSSAFIAGGLLSDKIFLKFGIF